MCYEDHDNEKEGIAELQFSTHKLHVEDGVQIWQQYAECDRVKDYTMLKLMLITYSLCSELKMPKINVQLHQQPSH
jgi:hypothetical protein